MYGPQPIQGNFEANSLINSFSLWETNM